MNGKTARIIRKVCEQIGLNYAIQKRIYKSLGPMGQEQYLRDLRKIHKGAYSGDPLHGATSD